MLEVASLARAPFARNDVDAVLLNGLNYEEHDGGLTSAEHSREISADASFDYHAQDKPPLDAKGAAPGPPLQSGLNASASTTRQVHQKDDEFQWEDDAEDSDYTPEEEEDDDDDDHDDVESDDSDHHLQHLRSLEMQLDDHADEVGDFYLEHMLATRAQLHGDDAAWVDSYIERQRQWKERHGTSIDEMDLDLRLGDTLGGDHNHHQKDCDYDHDHHGHRDDSSLRVALAGALNGRMSPLLPRALRSQSPEWLLSLAGVALFVAVALAVQFYVAFKAPQYV